MKNMLVISSNNNLRLCYDCQLEGSRLCEESLCCPLVEVDEEQLYIFRDEGCFKVDAEDFSVGPKIANYKKGDF